jgi:RNA polymerase sigma factor (sigma-70 family)
MYKFCRFLQFTNGDVHTWLTDQSLCRSMESFLKQHSQPVENFLVLSFYGLWQQRPSSIARNHLWAYLQFACLQASRKIAVVVRQQAQSISEYGLPNCFHIAIAETDVVLKHFPSTGMLSLESYARYRFWTLLRDKLRKFRIIRICTDWALLRGLDKKCLTAHLRRCGYGNNIETYVFALESFHEGYQLRQNTQIRALQEPDEKTWEKIAQIYRNKSSSQCELKEIQKLLSDCVRCVRDIYEISYVHISEDKEQYQDIYEDSSLKIFELKKRMDEYNEEQSKIEAFLVKLLESFDSEKQNILWLYYSQNSTQNKISKELDIPQYSVSRRLREVRKLLLKNLAIWSRDEMQINLNQDILNQLNILINEWLANYYYRTNDLIEAE